ncbi:hypothetical protein CMQ_4622 [Grosmannia clavigera kw1407]|uniref:Tuberous sclerosis 1 protein n=1 Tax=Grosmannia clavigera (strain kw1407 / UAMH 11150) TaxID=655863 RepID=F0XUS9_GROCL|nr:uncharacterized protein CMQ_4622 [Grosmannia clavigera kw1407]EFW98770.1 hypothetical protein CMQ_4622 [Grosmannia clavigera kw1407]
MASSGATRDLTRAINTFILSPKLPLPDDLTDIIEAYLDKHSDYDQSTSDRLEEELLSTFTKSVQSQQALYYASFLAILRRLRPSLRSPAHILLWWEKVIDPILDQLNQERGLMVRALNDINKFLVPDGEDEEGEEGDDKDGTNGSPSPIVKCLVQKWMDVCNDIQQGGDWKVVWVREKPIQDVITVFGRRRPMDFFYALNDLLVQKEYRSRSITLLSSFAQSQPPNLYLVIRSPLFDNLLRCLQYDTSTTVVSLALTSLTMLLPNMPGSIVPALPTLFNIYARILFWDREPQVLDEAQSDANRAEPHQPKTAWEKCTYAFDSDDVSIPYFQLLGYYNILYGLYPLNFMDYIRKPQRYLRHANVTGADDVEVQPSEIRDRSEQFRQCHLLHPNFYSLTIESEKTDFGRWRRSATADVVAECVGLHVYDQSGTDVSTHLHPGVAVATTSASSPFQSLEAGGIKQEEALLRDLTVLESSGLAQDRRLSTPFSAILPPPTSSQTGSVIRRSSQSSIVSDGHAPDAGGDSPTLSPLLSQSLSRTDLQGMVDSNKVVQSRLDQSLTNDSVLSLSLSNRDSAPEGLSSGLKPAVRPGPERSPSPHRVPTIPTGNGNENEESDLTAKQMQRQIIMLKTDLGFERYMVQQHLAHIGALRRSNMKQVVTEAETQNLILINRTLKNRMEEAKKAEAQVKKEAEMSRNRSKNWEESLANRLKKLREEQKKWKEEETTLRTSLKNSQADCARLLVLVCEKEVRELKLEQDLQMLEAGKAEKERLNERVRHLAAVEQEGQRLKEKLAEVEAEATAANSTLEVLNMKMEAREAEFRRAHDYFQKQIATVNSKLAEAQKSGQTAYNASLAETRAQVESALAASRAKNLELQKSQARLTRKCKILESKVFEQASLFEDQGLRGDNMPPTQSDQDTESVVMYGEQAMSGGSSIAGVSIDSGGSIAGPLRYGPRLASDAGSSESGPYRNPSVSGSSTGGAGPLGETGATANAQAERYYGRGGVQNSVRKERKDKKKDDKDRRSGGPNIRGIRGFVEADIRAQPARREGTVPPRRPGFRLSMAPVVVMPFLQEVAMGVEAGRDDDGGPEAQPRRLSGTRFRPRWPVTTMTTTTTTTTAASGAETSTIAATYVVSSAGLSAGAIAGITLGSVAGFLLLVGLLYVLYRCSDRYDAASVREEVVIRESSTGRRRRTAVSVDDDDRQSAVGAAHRRHHGRRHHHRRRSHRGPDLVEHEIRIAAPAPRARRLRRVVDEQTLRRPPPPLAEDEIVVEEEVVREIVDERRSSRRQTEVAATSSSRSSSIHRRRRSRSRHDDAEDEVVVIEEHSPAPSGRHRRHSSSRRR